MNKSEILNILMKYYGFDKKIEFANFLGVSSQVLSNWKSRNTFDIGLICEKCVEINPEWLISGTGNMVKSNNLLIKLKENSKRIPFVPFDEISLYEIDALNIDNFESNFFIIPAFNDADYLTEVKDLGLFPKFTSGDIIACKKINLFNLFFQSDKVFNSEYLIVAEDGTWIKKIKKYNTNDFFFLLSDNELSFEVPLAKIKSISIILGTIRLM